MRHDYYYLSYIFDMKKRFKQKTFLMKCQMQGILENVLLNLLFKIFAYSAIK